MSDVPSSIAEVIKLRALLQNEADSEIAHEGAVLCASIVDAIGDDLAALRAQNLKLQDKIDDLVQGLEFWKQHKVAAVESTTMDEMLMRWFEASS